MGFLGEDLGIFVCEMTIKIIYLFYDAFSIFEISIRTILLGKTPSAALMRIDLRLAIHQCHDVSGRCV